ncbi:hypothetical protein [Bradyrhizobium liaoningense]
MAAVYSVIGLVLSLIGVLLLFRYGMPFRIAAPEGDYIITEQPDPEGVEIDARYKAIGYVGLGLVVIGTLFQIAGSVVK